jgi:tungstate transport system substrate-binding protein
MHNDFILVGPRNDPAAIEGSPTAASALRRLSQARSLFISRGDNSGTHQMEQKLWRAAGVDPGRNRWYQETGQGMGATLRIASEKEAYTLVDRATYLANHKYLDMVTLLEGDLALYNVYHIILIDPSKSGRINPEGARAFADFLVGPTAQGIIGSFGKERFGQALFVADAGKPEPANRRAK